MSAKDHLVIGFINGMPPFLISNVGHPMSKKEARRAASAHVRQDPTVRKAQIVKVEEEVRGINTA